MSFPHKNHVKILESSKIIYLMICFLLFYLPLLVFSVSKQSILLITWNKTGTTILEAIREVVGAKTEVIYEENPSESINRSDYSFAIVVVGEAPYVESGGDSSDLKIHFNGAELASAVADQVPTLVILISGRPLAIDLQLLNKAHALVAAWLPGSEGSGVVDVIFGDHGFQGKLPMTWFKDVEQLPMQAESNSYDPLFPVGYGLTTSGSNDALKG